MCVPYYFRIEMKRSNTIFLAPLMRKRKFFFYSILPKRWLIFEAAWHIIAAWKKLKLAINASFRSRNFFAQLDIFWGRWREENWVILEIRVDEKIPPCGVFNNAEIPIESRTPVCLIKIPLPFRYCSSICRYGNAGNMYHHLKMEKDK